MKQVYHFFALLLLLVASPSFGQRIYSYAPEGKVIFQTSKDKILVKFKANAEIVQQTEILAQETAIEPIRESDVLLRPAVIIPSLKPGLSKAAVYELLDRLKRNPAVEFAHPFLVYKDGTLHGLQDVFIVGLKEPDDYADLSRLAEEWHLKIVKQNEFDTGAYHVAVTEASPGNALDLANRIFETGLFKYSEPDFLKLLEPFNTNDPYLYLQWALRNTGSWDQWSGTPGADMKVFQAWNISKGSPSIKVAIIDEGVDLDHPDLIANMKPGYDATGLGSQGNASGNDAHGTACAGIVAASGNNALGIAGVAYQSKIIPIRVAYRSGGNWVTMNSWQANGINWAWNTGGADVLSNSWGGGLSSSLVNDAIHAAVTSGRSGKGAPVLFASGNDNYTVSYPASNNETIAVGATSMCDERKSPYSCDGEFDWGSNYGTNLDLSAPGVKIATTDIAGSNGYYNTDYLADFNGTSSACPNAAGVMALVLSVNPNLNVYQARYILESTCDKAGSYVYSNNLTQPNGTWSFELGYGRVNAYKAVQAAQNFNCSPPSGIQATGLSQQSATIVFNAVPSALGYGVRYRPKNTAAWNEIFVQVPQAQLTGLQSCTDYEVQVRNICGGGWGIYSTTILFKTTGCSAPCAAPPAVWISQIANQSAQVNYTPVSGAQNYKVRYRQTGTASWFEIFASAPVIYYNLLGLQTCTEYEVQMQSVCSGGTSAYTPSVIFKTMGCVTPCDPPVITTVGNITANTAYVYFAAASNAQNYIIRYRKTGTLPWIENGPYPPQPFIKLVNLQQCTEYEVQMQTKCSTGNSSYSASTEFSTSGCVPLSASISQKTDVSCYGGNNGSATVSAIGGTPPYVYAWSNNTIQPAATALAAGVYTVTVSDVKGNQAIASATILQPNLLSVSINASPAQGTQSNGAVSASVNGGVPPYSYLWNTGQNTAQLTGLPAGAYTVTVQDAAGCFQFAVGVVDQESPACNPPVNVEITNISIYKATVQFSAPAGAQNYRIRWRPTGTVSWNAGITSQTAYPMSNLLSGTPYEVQVETVCDGTSSGYAAPVYFSTLAALSAIIVNATKVSCNGGSDARATVIPDGGLPPYTVLWDNGEKTITATQLDAGYHTVTTTDSQGNTFTLGLSISQPAAITILLNSKPATGTLSDGSVVSTVVGGTKPYTYDWSTGASTTGIENLGPGTYTLTITDANNCTAEKTGVVDQTTGIHENPVNWRLDIYPNPASDFAQVILPALSAEPVMVTIYNSAGQLQNNWQIITGTENVLLDVSGLAAGLYIVRLNTKSESYASRLIVNR